MIGELIGGLPPISVWLHILLVCSAEILAAVQMFIEPVCLGIILDPDFHSDWLSQKGTKTDYL